MSIQCGTASAIHITSYPSLGYSLEISWSSISMPDSIAYEHAVNYFYVLMASAPCHQLHFIVGAITGFDYV